MRKILILWNNAWKVDFEQHFDYEIETTNVIDMILAAWWRSHWLIPRFRMVDWATPSCMIHDCHYFSTTEIVTNIWAILTIQKAKYTMLDLIFLMEWLHFVYLVG